MNPIHENEPEGQPEVPAQLFEEFVTQLEKAETPADVVERLRATIIHEKDLSEKAIRAALFPEEQSDD
jgi:hypothetical protein